MIRNSLTVTGLLAAAFVVGCQSNTPAPMSTKSDTPKPMASSDKGTVSTTTSDAARLAELERIANAARTNPAVAAKPSDKHSSEFVPKPSLPATEYDKAGFATKVEKGRLWVFKSDAPELAEFVSKGELAKSVTKIGVGPGGMSVRSADVETIAAYLAAPDPYARPGFVTKFDDGRLWVFKADAKELTEFNEKGELAKMVTRIAAGPNRTTLRAPDVETIEAYLASGK